MKVILKVHQDVITVPKIMKELMQEYAGIGYEVKKISIMNFKLVFPDGWVHIFWENGCVYQEIIEEGACLPEIRYFSILSSFSRVSRIRESMRMEMILSKIFRISRWATVLDLFR